MSLPWVQVDKGFARSTEAIALAYALGVSRPHAVGLAVEFWAWAADHAADGRLVGALSALVVDEVVGWQKPTKEAPSFFEAMLSVGLLERDEGGTRICGWGRYAKALEKAAKDAVRKRARRQNGADLSADIPAAGAKTARADPADDRASGAGKSQSQTESQSQTPPSVVANPLPPPPEIEVFAWLQNARQKAIPGVMDETPPLEYLAWYGEAVATKGVTVDRLCRGYVAFLRDKWARGLKPPCPIRAFMKKWREYLPRAEVAA